MLTAYYLVLAVVLLAALATPSSRRAVLVMVWSWAVSAFMGSVGMWDFSLYVDAVAFWGLFWCAAKGSPRSANAARITALLLFAHFAFSLADRLGFYVPGVYMWSVNALVLAAALSLVGGKDVRCFVGLCLEGARSLSGCGPRPSLARRAASKEAGR